MTAMRCLLLLGALRAATALAPEAVEALLSIGDGERLSYLDFRESLHNEWSRNVSAPAVAARSAPSISRHRIAVMPSPHCNH